MIAFDAATSGGTNTTTALAWDHTFTGFNGILIVAAANDTADNTNYFTGATCNGVPMTQLDTFHSQGAGGTVLYYFLNPVVGVNHIVVNLSSSKSVYGASTSYTGIRQTGQPDAASGVASDPASNLTQNITVSADQSWLISCASKKAGSGATISAGANTTARVVNGFIALGDSNGKETPPGSFGQTWNVSAPTGMAVIAASVAPAQDAGGSFLFELM